MDSDFKKALERMRSLPDAQLRRIIAAQIPQSPDRIAAEHEQARRKSRLEFWRKDIVAWIALAVSGGSLILSIISLVASLHRS